MVSALSSPFSQSTLRHPARLKSQRRPEGRGRVAGRGMTQQAPFLLVRLELSGLFHMIPGAPTFPCYFPFAAFRYSLRAAQWHSQPA